METQIQTEQLNNVVFIQHISHVGEGFEIGLERLSQWFEGHRWKVLRGSVIQVGSG